MAVEKSLITKDILFKVSSVLNKNVKEFGKKHLFDDNNETCWNSDQGISQWITIQFPNVVQVKKISIQFQGGFSAKDLILFYDDNVIIKKFHPDDINSIQDFEIENESHTKCLKLVFENFTDFYGRITIYKLNIFGTILNSELV